MIPLLRQNKFGQLTVYAGRTRILSQGFHTTTPRQVPPIVIALIKPLARFGAMFIGRAARKMLTKMPEDTKNRFRTNISRNKPLLGGLGALLIGTAGYGYFSHIQECPITKRKRFVALTQDQVEKIAEVEYNQLKETHTRAVLPADHPAYGRIVRVANKILKSNLDLAEIKKKNWTVTVIDESDRNAFVLPSGHIFVFTGMLRLCNNDDQLGIILSHEMAHTLLGHAGENLSYINLLSAALMIPLAVLWAFLPNDGIALVADWFFNRATSVLFELPFSRDMETEADEVGLMLAAKACFDIREAPAFWAKMKMIESAEDPSHQMPIELLSTHPSHEQRESHLISLLPEALEKRESCNCPRLSSTNPYEEFKKYREKIRALALQEKGPKGEFTEVVLSSL